MEYAVRRIGENELEHYGVLGMKWGIRRYQPYPPGKHGTFLGQTRDEDIRIRKDTTAYRVASAKTSREAGELYVSFLKEDNISYIETAQDAAGVAVSAYGNDNNGYPYNLKLKLTRDVIAPSYNKSMEAFINTVDKYKSIEDFANEIQPSKEAAKNFIKNYGDINSQDALDEAYIQFVGSFMRDTTARRMFFQELSNQGYNAVVDEWDKRFDKTNVDSPMILFEGSTAATTASEPLSQRDYDYFWSVANLDRETLEEYRKSDYFRETENKWKKFYK